MTNGNGILYCTDPEKDENVATLNLFKDGKAVEIDDDVTTYDYNEAGKIVYLKDYNFKKYRGDLMMYEKGESVKLDEDVTSILYFY